MWFSRQKKTHTNTNNLDMYTHFNGILEQSTQLEHTDAQTLIWSNCFKLSTWLFATDPNKDEPTILVARSTKCGDRLCAFAFTDARHVAEFYEHNFGTRHGFLADSPQHWVSVFSVESSIEVVMFNDGPKGWSWFIPVENLSYTYKYLVDQGVIKP